MNALTCPECRTALSKRKTVLGLVWVCPACRGRALTLRVVRRAVPKTVVNRLWQDARSNPGARRRGCPACRRRMTEVPIAGKRETVHLDVCTGCHFVWFDHRELAALPQAPRPQAPPEKPLSPKAREALALSRLEMVKQMQQAQRGAETPDDWRQYLLGFCLRFPVEYNDAPLQHRPWATWLTVALIALVSILSFRNLDAAIQGWGLIPAQLGRHWGLTLITSFFLHAGIWHLAGNLYFLWIFGDNTEDVLGKGRFLGLLVLSALVGDVLHILSDPSSSVPCVGASGGISGVVAYYCLRFPRASIGMFVYLHWVRLPAWAMFALWLAFQIYEACLGDGSVAVFAHLGGAVVGVVFWWLTRRSVARMSKAIEPNHL